VKTRRYNRVLQVGEWSGMACKHPRPRHRCLGQACANGPGACAGAAPSHICQGNYPQTSRTQSPAVTWGRLACLRTSAKTESRGAAAVMRSAPKRLKRLEQAEARWEAGAMGLQKIPSPCRKSYSGVVDVRKRDAWVRCEYSPSAALQRDNRLACWRTTHQQRK
jgi:hypothetical protein